MKKESQRNNESFWQSIPCSRGHAQFVGERPRREKEKGGGKNLCVWKRGGEIFVRTCMRVNERTSETDKELNEPTCGPNLANFLKTHLRPVFLLSERPPLKPMKVLLRNRGGFSRRVLEGRPSMRPQSRRGIFTAKKNCGVRQRSFTETISTKWDGI